MIRTLSVLSAVLFAPFAIAADTSDWTGGWRLNPTGTRFIDPAHAPKDLIWDIKVDQDTILWNLTIVPKTGDARIESFESKLNGGPRPITGTLDQTTATAQIKDGRLILKILPASGLFKEISTTCVLNADKKQLNCQGVGTKAEGGAADFNTVFNRL